MPAGWPDSTKRHAACDTYHKISAASTNADSIVAAAAVLCGYYIVNTNSAFRYVKLYDTAGTPTAGSGTPKVVLGIPGSSAANVAFTYPILFSSGIGVTMVTGVADSDATAVAANDLAATVYFI